MARAARARPRGGRRRRRERRTAGRSERARRRAAPERRPTRFTGYETKEQDTTVGALQGIGGGEHDGSQRFLVKLAESPFYAPGGGQVADSGTIECDDGRLPRARHRRDPARRGSARRGRAGSAACCTPASTCTRGSTGAARHATEANHTATHLLQAALRERLGSHIRQAGSYVGPDKLRFDFSHGQGLTAEELRDVEDRVNEWISRNDPVRAITTTLDEARALGAMALFGEKYGEVVRMVEVGGGEYSRELCGGTHVRQHRRDRSFPDPQRDLELGERAAHRGRHRARGGGAAAHPRRAARRDRRRAADTARAGRGGRARGSLEERRRLEKELEQAAAGGGGGAGVEELVAAGGGGRRRDGAGAGRRSSGRQGAAGPDRPCQGQARRQPRSCSARRPTGACISSRASLPSSSLAASRRARSSRPPPRSSAAAAAGATRWPRPAGAIRRSSARRSRPGAAAIEAALNG